MERSIDGLLYDIIAYLKANKHEKSNAIFLKRCEEAYKKQLMLGGVVGRSEQLVCPVCKSKKIEIRYKEQSFKCKECKEGWAN